MSPFPEPCEATEEERSLQMRVLAVGVGHLLDLINSKILALRLVGLESLDWIGRIRGDDAFLVRLVQASAELVEV